MALTKKQRESLKNKFGGKCAYCGCRLENHWHADHVEPIYRKIELVRVHESKPRIVKQTGECCRPELDNLNNLFPACAVCNRFKSVFGIEEFRQEISYQIERCRKYSVNFRMAEKFNQVRVEQKPIVFWFESFIDNKAVNDE